MEFEWDQRKASTNRRKHGIDFADSVSVFEDTLALTVPDEHLGEDRFVSLGADSLGRIWLSIRGAEKEFESFRLDGRLGESDKPMRRSDEKGIRF